MLKQVVTVGPIVAAVANFYAVSATPVSGTPLTLTGAVAPIARRVRLTYGSEGGARTLALTGKDAAGNTLQETLAVPSGAAGTVDTVQDFVSVTKAVPAGGGWTAAMMLGTSPVASSPWRRVTEHIAPVNISVNAVVSGTVNYSVEITNDEIEPALPTSTVGAPYGPLGPIPRVPTPFPLPGALEAQSANATGLIAQPILYWRLVLNSGTGSVTATAIEAGIIQGH
jgi:hypothetical protein